MPAKLEFKFSLASHGEVSPPQVRLWIDENDTMDPRDDIEVALARPDLAKLDWVGSREMAADKDPDKHWVQLKMLGSIGAKWTLTVTRQDSVFAGKKYFDDGAAIERRPDSVWLQLRRKD